MRFRSLAASDPLLRWDVRLTDLWLECFSDTPAPMTQWPCVHCGATTHHPENCLFVLNLRMSEPLRGLHPSPALTSAGGQHPPLTPGTVSQPGQLSNNRPAMAQPSRLQP